MAKKITPKEESLIQAMLIERNHRKAMLKSDYNTDNMKPETLDNTGYKIMNRPHVKARYDILHAELMKQSEEEGILSAKYVLQEIKDMLETDITDIAEIINVEEIERDEEGNIIYGSDGKPITDYRQIIRIKDTEEMSKAALKSISEIGYNKYGIYIKRYDKQKTIDQAGKHLKLFTDKVEHSGEIKMPVIKISKG